MGRPLYYGSEEDEEPPPLVAEEECPVHGAGLQRLLQRNPFRHVHEIYQPPLRGERERPSQRFDLSTLEWDRVFTRSRQQARGETVQTDHRGNTRILTYVPNNVDEVPDLVSDSEDEDPEFIAPPDASQSLLVRDLLEREVGRENTTLTEGVRQPGRVNDVWSLGNARQRLRGPPQGLERDSSFAAWLRRPGLAAQLDQTSAEAQVQAVLTALEESMGRAYHGEFPMRGTGPASGPSQGADEATLRRPRGTLRRPRQRQRVFSRRDPGNATDGGDSAEDSAVASPMAFPVPVGLLRPPARMEADGDLGASGVQVVVEAESQVCV